jgi:hypothetical protein
MDGFAASEHVDVPCQLAVPSRRALDGVEPQPNPGVVGMVAVEPGVPCLGVLDEQLREIGHGAALRCGRGTGTQAKRLAVGIEQHPPASSSWLEVRLAGSDRAQGLGCLVEVVYLQVEVEAPPVVAR